MLKMDQETGGSREGLFCPLSCPMALRSLADERGQTSLHRARNRTETPRSLSFFAVQTTGQRRAVETRSNRYRRQTSAGFCSMDRSG